MKMTEYRLRAVMDFLADFRGYATINQVAEGIGMSWNTAKNDLEYLSEDGYVLKKGSKFKFNFEKKI
jgi:DNA-binding Lrp family transcriptional regulator